MARLTIFFLTVVILCGCNAKRGDNTSEKQLISSDDTAFGQGIPDRVRGLPDIIPDVVSNYLYGLEYPDSLLLDTAIQYGSGTSANGEYLKKLAMTEAYTAGRTGEPNLSDRLGRVNQAFFMYLIFTSIRDKATLERRDLHELSVLIRVGSASLINPVRLAEVMDRFPDPIKADPDWQEKRSLLDRPSLVGTTLFDVPDAALRTKGSMDTLSLREILRTLDGDAVLVFTASWCRPCHTDYDIYKDHFRELENKGVRVISYSVDQNHSRWERYVDKPGYLRECYLDTDASDSAWLKQLGIQSVPRYLLIDRTGEITGHFSSAQLRGLFDRYL